MLTKNTKTVGMIFSSLIVKCPRCYEEIVIDQEKAKKEWAYCPHCGELLSEPKEKK